MTPEQVQEMITKIREEAIHGLLTDGSHHKQHSLETILQLIGVDLNELRKELLADDYGWEPGIPS